MKRTEIGVYVVVSGRAGRDRCEVLHIATPDEMPAIDGLDVDQVRAIMAEWSVDYALLLLGRLESPEPVMFWVLHLAPDLWRDLQGEPLTVAPLRGKWGHM